MHSNSASCVEQKKTLVENVQTLLKTRQDKKQKKKKKKKKKILKSL